MPVSPEQLAEWRRRYGRSYVTSIRGKDYFFRALTVREHSSILNNPDNSSAEIEDAVVEIALLEPEVTDTLPAGIFTSLAEQILNISGFGEAKYAKRVLDEQRDIYGQVVGLMKAFVLATMPAYTEEDLDNYNYSQLAAKVALAERIIEVQRAVLPMAAGDGEVKLNLIDPEEEALKEQTEAQKHAAQKKSGQAGLHDPIAQKLHQAL